jgi:organic radical activating enzyme
MKWLHQTLYLHTGDNHSCYHPRPHHIPLDEIAADPSALHNTQWKKEQRKTMLEGGRPDECYYCWNIEDLPGEHISDRMIHSSSDFAAPHIEKLAELPWDAPINPRYLEVSFGNNCNYRCGYCSPQASTAWMEEIKKFGNHDLTYNQYGIEFLKTGTYYGPKDENPYIEAFWKWWPSLKHDLHTLRITGGEPLMHRTTWKLFDQLREDPRPHLELNLNSNLGVKPKLVEKLADNINDLLATNKVKRFKLFTSMDTYYERAEYIRTGLKLDVWEQNLDTYITKTKSPIAFMCTFNILSVTSFTDFLAKVLEWRTKYDSVFPKGDNTRMVRFDTPYLKEPLQYDMQILPKEDFLPYFDEILKFIDDNRDENDRTKFSDLEYERFRRVRDYFATVNYDEHRIQEGRKDFYNWFTEYDKRRKVNFLETFPEMKNFWETCKAS